MRWTVVASGPSGKGLTAAELQGTVICVNNSIQWVDRMDVYFFRRGFHHEQFDDLVAKGVRLVAFRRRKGLMWTPKMPRNDWAQVQFLQRDNELHRCKELGLPDWIQHVEQIQESQISKWNPYAPVPKVPDWKLGTYSEQVDPIGPSAVQFALNNGATSLHIFGMEGGDRQADGDLSPEMQQSANMHWAALQGCVNTCPDIEVVIYGETLYPAVEGPNVRMMTHQP